MTFSRLYDLLLYNVIEESSFADLPDRPPYGFWIHPDGDFSIIIKPYNHNDWALKLAELKYQEEFAAIKERFMPTRFKESLGRAAHDFLLEKGYARVVMDDSLIFCNTSKASTNRQTKTLKDLSAFYGLRIHNDR